MKHSITLFFFILFALVMQGQAPGIEWQRTIGGDDWDALRSLEKTADGGYILGGYSGSGISGDKTEESLFEDYWVLKTDSAGNIEWQNAIGGAMGEALRIAQSLADGGYILAGDSWSGISGDKSEACRGETDFWIVKTGSEGEVIWDKTFGGNTYDNLTSFIQTADGGFLAGGCSANPLSGDKTEDNAGGAADYGDYWLIRLDSEANIIWQNTIGGDRHDYLSCMQQTSDGGYIIGGSSQSDISGDKTEENAGSDGGLTPDTDYWILKLDEAGNIIWQNTIGGNNVDYLEAIQQTDDGGFILGGSSASSIGDDKTEDSRGDSDYWILKVDAEGNILWQHTYGGSGQDELSAFQQTAEGGFIIGGTSSSGISGDKTENTFDGANDMWLLKLSPEGELEWQKTIGDDGKDDCKALQITGDGGCIAAGSNSFYDDGYIPDYWVVKLSFTADAIEQFDADDFAAIFPNPASEQFFIELQLPESVDDVQITLVNMLGETVYASEKDLGAGLQHEVVQLGGIPPAIYIVQIISQQFNISRNIIIN